MSLQAAAALPVGLGGLSLVLYLLGRVGQGSYEHQLADGTSVQLPPILVGIQMFAQFVGAPISVASIPLNANPALALGLVLLRSPEACIAFILVGAFAALIFYYLSAVVLPGVRMDMHLSRIPGIPEELVFAEGSSEWHGEACEVFAPDECFPGSGKRSIVKRYVADGKVHIPQTTRKWPILGHALSLLGPAPWSKMALWSLSARSKDAKGDKVGRLVTFNVTQRRVVYINEPQLLKKVLLTKQRFYNKDISNSYYHFMCLLGTGLVTSEGDRWRKGRLLLSHALRIDILHDVPTMTMHAVRRIMEKLDKATGTLAQHETGANPGKRKSGDESFYIDLNEEYRHMTLQVIGETALSLTPEETDRIFPALYLPIVHECNRRVWAPWREFMPFLQGSKERGECLARLNEVLCDIIRGRWTKYQESLKTSNGAAEEKRPDIMQLCMSQIKKMDDSMVMQLRDDVKTMLLAGHETSAALLTWATYELICNPEYRDHVVEEARKLFQPRPVPAGYVEGSEVDGRSYVLYKNTLFKIPTVEEIRCTLRWTPAVLRETLRKHSVVPLVMREAMKDDVWTKEETGLPQDVTIPAGCTIAVGVLGVHMRPDVWKDPTVFDPNRFLDAVIANDTNQLVASSSSTGADASAADTHIDQNKVIDPYAYIPFINGPRNCLGQHLSIMETQTALAFFMLNHDLALYNTSKDYSGVFAAPAPEKLSDKGGISTPVKRAAMSAEDAAFARQVGVHHDYIIPRVPHDGLKVFAMPEKKTH